MDLQIIIIGLLAVLIIGMFIIAAFTIRLFKMHDVKNENGEYAFMIPTGYSDLQKQINTSQERIVGVMSEMLKNSVSQGELLRTLTNKVLEMHQDSKGDTNGSN